MFDSMTVNTSGDFLIFASVFVCGVFIGLIFDIFRTLRVCFGGARRFVSMQDAAFCTLSFALFTAVVNEVAKGKIRWFTIAGLVLGIGLYFLCISFYARRFLKNIFLVLAKFMGCIFSLFKKIFCFFASPFARAQMKIKEKICTFNCTKRKDSQKKQKKARRSGLFFKKIFTSQKK